MEQSSARGERLTEDEAEQYDRQIRLWGLEAQKRSVRTSSTSSARGYYPHVPSGNISLGICVEGTRFPGEHISL